MRALKKCSSSLLGAALALLVGASPVAALEIALGEVGFELLVGDSSVWSQAYVGTPDSEDPNALSWGDGSESGAGLLLERSGVEGDVLMVPEPTPLVLLGVGLVGLAIAGRRKRRG